jgi:hypothetical protein
MVNDQREYQARRCADWSGNPLCVRFRALFLSEPGDVIAELTPIALLDQIVQRSQVRVRRRLYKHPVRAQGPFDTGLIHGDVVSGFAGMFDGEDRTRQHDLEGDFARVGILVADGIAEQGGTPFESDVGHLDNPVAKLLPNRIRVLRQRIAL